MYDINYIYYINYILYIIYYIQYIEYPIFYAYIYHILGRREYSSARQKKNKYLATLEGSHY